MLDTDQLRSFLAIVDSGSFTKAAERVHKTQSAVSMHIRRLEEQLGCALFVKQGRGARLTAEGERLIEFARRIVQVEAGAMAALSRKGLRGAARLGIPDDYAEAFLADILSRFNRRHPLVEVSVVCEASTELAPQVAAGRARSGSDHRLSRGSRDLELLREEPLVWVAAERFPVEEGTPIPLALGSPTCLLAARDRGGAGRGARRDAGAVLSRRTSARSAPCCGPGSRRRSCPLRWSVRACGCWGAPKACRNCP